jgi:phage major head subunit gpT-like protein
MLINSSSLASLLVGFKASFQEGFSEAPTYAATMAMKTTSSASDETYGWLGSFPNMREWLGDRVINNLRAHSYTVKNKLFEMTVEINRIDLEDDRIGIYGPMMRELGRAAAVHPDMIVSDLLRNGTSLLCYDGQYFFDTDHPVGDAAVGGVASISNYTTGSADTWYLLDLGRAIKPFIWQERLAYSFQSMTRDEDENVFMRDRYLYGVRARANAGFGLWQLAHASKAALTGESYAAARRAMRSIKGDGRRPLGIRPTHLLVPPSLEEAALQIVNAENQASGATNVWQGSAKLIVSEWLA